MHRVLGEGHCIAHTSMSHGRNLFRHTPQQHTGVPLDVMVQAIRHLAELHSKIVVCCEFGVNIEQKEPRQLEQFLLQIRKVRATGDLAHACTQHTSARVPAHNSTCESARRARSIM